MNNQDMSKKKADSLINWLRAYASKEIDSYLADKQGLFPPHIFMDLAEKGFFGMPILHEYQGLALNFSDMLRVLEQLGAIDLTLATIIIENIQGAHTIENYASHTMKKQYLNRLAKGRLLTAGAMTESSAGSNPRAMKSIAIPYQGDKWLLQGSKRWVGMASSAELIAVYVQQLDRENNWMGMSGFLVPRGTKGLRIGPASPTMGLRGFSKHAVYLDDIIVSSEHLLGKPGEGMEIAQDNMMHIRLCLAAASIGAMKRCIQLMIRYAQRRTIVTGLLIENPVTLVQLSETTAIIDTLDNFIYTVAGFYDHHPSSIPEEAFVVSKILGSEYLGRITDRLMQLLGARGYEEQSGIPQLFRDARVFRIFEGPTEALNMYLGSRGLEKNLAFEKFISITLSQKELFEEMKTKIESVNKNCHKNYPVFAHSFSIDYWCQALVGEIISYGLLLAVTEYSFAQTHSKKLHRASLWARNKYNEIINKSLRLSSGEKLLVALPELEGIISDYGNTIGDIEQTRTSSEIDIDNYLKKEHNNPSEINSEERFFEKQSLPNSDSFLAPNPLIAESFNEMEKEIIPNQYIHQLFEQQALLTPDAVALTFENKKISYQELNSRANQVAHYLIKKGVGANKIVAIYMERSIEMIIGLLGILKSGGAYLPLDYSYPIKSLQFMFEDSHSEMILSHKKLENKIPFKANQLFFIENIISNSSEESIHTPQTPINLDNIGYLIYTSGSTGKPKGVLLPHKALVNLVNWHQKKIPGKRNVLQFTALSFDMSLLEIFSALTSGGSLVLISEQDRKDPWQFSKIIQTHHVDQLVLPVAFLKTLTSTQIDKTYFNQIKEIILAGEQITLNSSLLSFFRPLSTCKLLNYYGPSETHVVTAYTFPEKVADWPAYPPIGRPIYNTRIVLLDEQNQPTKPGAIGEIHIGGSPLAKGYINQQELTQEKFIVDCWSNEKDSRLYKTGDLGKYLPDGQLIFVSRKDEQLKIRGFRIEPQEIETQLIRHPSVKEACVIAKKRIGSEKHLEAFIVIEESSDEKVVNRVYTFIQDRVPPYMIPSVINIIKEMPLTDSGKIDRKKLAKSNDSISFSINRLEEATTETERELIKSIECLFNFPIGINHSFAALGGNSLLAMHMVSLIRNKFSVELPAHAILSDPKISDTAKRIDLLIQGS